MTRINTNVSSLVAQNRLNKTNSDLQTSLTRLSTGLRINSGKDDPAGLIASEALRSDITSINKAISNTQRASQIIATADSALGQVSSLLNDVRGLVVEAANKGALSDDEIAANQLQVDSSLEAINRIAQTTTFQGRRLLDGSLDFVTKAGAGSGVIKDLKIDQANLGAIGQINVNIKISTAASRATVSTSGIPAAVTPVKSTGTINFSAPSAAAEATGTIALANSFTIGAEATAALTFTNAYTPALEASGTINLGSGVALDIAAVNGGAADGAVGNDTIINVQTNTTGTSTASYDATTKTLTLSLAEGDNAAAIAADLASNADFAITADAGTANSILATDAGILTGELSGGTNATAPTAGLTLSAVNGGLADGLQGNSTSVVFTSGTTTGAAYDATNNIVTVSIAAGATVSQIAAAINTDLSGNFQASNVTSGSFKWDPADNTTASLSGGTNPTLASQFKLTAKNGGLADGTKGNTTSLVLAAAATGAPTAATYDAVTNQLSVAIGANATTQDVVNAINTQGAFVANNVQNGNALFSATNYGTSTPLAGGTNTTANDVITVTADQASPDFDGVTIALTGDNALAAGTATASLVSGNIQVRVSSNGPVTIGAISSAINDLEGFSANVSATAGDGVYDITTDTAATTTALAGGVFGGGLNADLVVRLTGATGAEVFQFQKGASISSVIQSINLVKDATGIEAENDGGNLKLNSTAYGSEGLVDVEVVSEGAGGTFKSGLTASRAKGTDIQATVNGTAATGKGNVLSLNTATLDLSLTVTDGSSADISFTITGGGAQFQLGPEVVSNQQARLGIGSLNTAKLGGASGRLYELAKGGSKALDTDATGASRIVDEAINQVTSLRGRLGAFQATTLESNLVSLNETVANLTEAESSIRDADFAAESARLTRAQILVQSGTSVLGIANQNPQNVLSLLR